MSERKKVLILSEEELKIIKAYNRLRLGSKLSHPNAIAKTALICGKDPSFVEKEIPRITEKVFKAYLICVAKASVLWEILYRSSLEKAAQKNESHFL